MKALNWLLAIAGIYWVWNRSKESAPAANVTAPALVNPANPGNAIAVAGALGGYPLGTPVLYHDGDVLRETTAGNLADAYNAVAVTGNADYLPQSELPAREAPGSGSVIGIAYQV